MADSSENWRRLCAVMNAYVASEVLAAGCELDLFSFLAKGPAPLSAIAPALGLSEHGARVLLLGCAAAGAVERDASGAYRNAAWADEQLVRGRPRCMLSFVKFNHDVQQRCMHRLTESLRERRNAGLDELPGAGATLYDRLAQAPTLERLFHSAMGSYTENSPKVVDYADFARVERLLDVGGGDASLAMVLASKYPSLQVTVFDKPSVCAIAAARVASAGLSTRIAVESGDFFVDPWPNELDGVLLSHVVEIFSPERVRGLYGRALAALRPQGKLFIWTITSNDDETGGLQAAKSSAYFLTTASGEGMAYPGREHVAWLREVGFAAIDRTDWRDLDHALFVATAP